MYVIPSSDYVLDSDNKTITLSGEATTISLVQIKQILNLDKSELIYSVDGKQGTITLESGVITYEEAGSTEDGDIIRIEIDETL